MVLFNKSIEIGDVVASITHEAHGPDLLCAAQFVEFGYPNAEVLSSLMGCE